MKIQFFGAARTVTGSCYIIDACGARFAVDCGMHQGNKAIEERNSNTDAYEPARLDFILVTHAHIDHSGLLPRMVGKGFSKPIYCTAPTLELLEIMLRDSAHIQEMEAEARAKKYSRRGISTAVAPLYSMDDVEKTLPLLQKADYDATFEPHPGIKVTYHDAGHILGSSFLLLEITEEGKTTRLLFSGDLGRQNALIVRDPDAPLQADYIFLESTYGDRDHKNEANSAQELAEAIAYSYARGEKVIIPAFAVERTQEVLYCLHMLAKQGKLPDMPIFVDSPMAIRATEVFRRHRNLFDSDAHALLAAGEDPFELPRLTYTLKTDESRAINDVAGPAIIISASGMCNAGRIKHHLRHNLWREGASIVFVGYQGVGTPGRKLVEKATSLSLFGEDVDVKARIFTIGGFSAHAGQSQLLEWIAPVAKSATRIVLVHGEENAQHTLADLIQKRFGVSCHIPDYLEEMELTPGAEPVVIASPEQQVRPRVDWDFLTGDIEHKWRAFKEKLATLEQRPWVEQTELRDRMERMNYELTKLIAGM